MSDFSSMPWFFTRFSAFLAFFTLVVSAGRVGRLRHFLGNADQGLKHRPEVL
jgi:hypothetical protein